MKAKVNVAPEGYRKRWKEVEVKAIGMGIVKDEAEDVYYRPGQWKADGVKTPSHEKWFPGEAMRVEGRPVEYRFGGYTPKGWIITLNMAMGYTGVTCRPEHARRP